MRAAFLAAVVVGGSVAVFCACGETSNPLPAEGDAGVEGKESGVPPPRDAGGSKPTGERAPTGCLLETTGYLGGSKAENIARDGVPNAASWTDVESALTDDGKFASVTLADGQESAKLRVSGFGFSVPSTAETWGIAVELKRRAPDGGVEDDQINIEVEGKPSRFKYISGPWPASVVGTHSYGQAVDTWGIDLVPADVNTTTFSTTLTVKRAANTTGPVTAIVDSLKIAVHFCPVPIKK